MVHEPNPAYRGPNSEQLTHFSISCTYPQVEEAYEVIEEGPASTVSRTWVALEEDDEPQWVVVKTATTNRRFAKEPHDIVKELRVLCGITHINVSSDDLDFFVE